MSENQSLSISFTENSGTTAENDSLSITMEENLTIFAAAECLTESWWNVFDKKYFRHSWNWSLILIVTYTLTLVIGVVGNGIVILVYILRPKMRSVTNIFIINLAVADLFVIVFCVGPTLFANLFKHWIFGSFMCKCVAYVQGVSVCASAFSLALVSFERCQSIYGVFQRLSKTQALAAICLIWIIALLVTSPWAVVFDIVISDEDRLTYCVETWKNENHGKTYFLLVNIIFCYVLPFIIIAVSNGIVCFHVVNRIVPQNSDSDASIRQMHRKARNGVGKMLAVLTFTFLLSWMPLYIIVCRYKFSEDLTDWELTLYPFAQWLGISNSSVNPILYGFLSKRFRVMLKSVVLERLPCTANTAERQ